MTLPKLARGKAEGIPHRYSGQTPPQVASSMVGLLSKATEYLEGKEPGWPGAILHGPLGRGKTSSAIEVLRLFDANGYAGIFEVLYNMVGEIKNSWGTDLGEREATKRFIRPAVLVVDEVGVQFDTEAERNILYSIIVKRHNMCLPTLMTTNYDLDTPEGMSSFCESVGSRIANRFDGYMINAGGWGKNLRTRREP